MIGAMGRQLLVDSDYFTGADEDAIAATSIIACVLSIIGSTFIIIIMLYFKKLGQNLHFKLVFMLSAADIINSVSFFFGNPSRGDTTGLCTFQGILQQFGGTFSYSWIVAIAVTLYRTVFAPDDTFDDEDEEEQVETVSDKKTADNKKFMYYCIGITAYSVFMTILPFFGGTYGDAGAWCWIDNSTTGKVWRFMAFYVPVWIAMIVIGYCYTCVVLQLRKTVAQEGDQTGVISRAMSRLAAYPVIMFIGYIFGTINRIQNAAEPTSPSVGLYCFATFTLNINGFLNAFVYGCNDSMQQDFRNCLDPDRTGGDDEGPPEVETNDSQNSPQMMDHSGEMREVSLSLDDKDKEDIVAVAELQDNESTHTGRL